MCLSLFSGRFYGTRATRTAKSNERKREGERAGKESESTTRPTTRLYYLPFSPPLSLSLSSSPLSSSRLPPPSLRLSSCTRSALETLDILIPTDRPSLSSLSANERAPKEASILPVTHVIRHDVYSLVGNWLLGSTRGAGYVCSSKQGGRLSLPRVSFRFSDHRGNTRRPIVSPRIG